MSEHASDGVAIECSSPLRLCLLLQDLVQGTAYYGDTGDVQPRMQCGDSNCMFEVRLAAAQIA